MAGTLNNIPKPPTWAPGAEFWMSSFWKLNSCRNIGMGEGPIPWQSIYTYGILHLKMDEDMFSMLEDIIFELDRIYLTWRSEQSKQS